MQDETTLSPTAEYIDLSTEELIQTAVHNHEATISANGALTVLTGARTGRSPNDRFIVKDDTTAKDVDWGKINKPFDPHHFNQLWQKALSYVTGQDHYIAHLQVGADTNYAVPVKVINEFAWQNLFANNLFIRKQHPDDPQQWTLLSAPNFHPDPKQDGTHSDAAIILNFSDKRILVCGTRYAGEMKKSMFSVLNFLLPPKDVLPMHCSANVGENGESALFFGLSGTGKTTLSADPERYLIGDDEHGWSPEGIFNFEGGCYAKCINLSQEKEPMIWDAIRRGAIMENVVLEPTSQLPDYTDDRYTQNSRAAYPLEHIEKRRQENQASHPTAVIFLTCDLHGVLPPVALLTKEQAAYHFLSGYTALVGSTEVGQTEAIKQTFSACFGAPFFSRPPAVYAQLLMKRIEQTQAQVYLVNTGWTGGAYGEGGERFDIPVTRRIISAILNGQLRHANFNTLPGFKLSVPQAIDGIDPKLLDPKLSWQDASQYDSKLNQLIKSFQENFKQFVVSDDILQAQPEIV